MLEQVELRCPLSPNIMASKIFVNAKIVRHDGVKEGALAVKDGKIWEVWYVDGLEEKKSFFDKLMHGESPDESKFDEVIDLKGKYLLPGLVDAHVHFRTPGHEAKEDWTTGSKAALAGGVTTVLDMPNNDPPTIDEETLSEKRKVVAEETLVNYGFFVGATDENAEIVGKIKGMAGVKAYLGSSTGNLFLHAKIYFEKLLENTEKIVAVHAESELVMLELASEYEGKDDPSVHSLIRSPESAYESVKDTLHLAKKYGKKIHLCHVSTEKELEAVRKFKDENVSVEVTPHHLFLTTLDYEKLGNLIKVNPPVREPADQVVLWQGIKDGTVNIVATDHAPHTLAEKKKNYKDVPSGVPGVQTMLPLLLNAVNEGKLSLEKVVELTSYNPSKIFGIKNKGMIEKGMDADLTVVDMDLEEEVDKEFLFSKCGWSPFEGRVLKGWPVLTFVNGEKMYEWRDRFGEVKGREVSYQ